MDPKLFMAVALSLLAVGCTLKGTPPENATNSSNGTLAQIPQAPPAPATAPAMSPGSHQETLQYGGFGRNFILYVPPSYDGIKAYPLVVVLHGAGGTAKGMEKMSGFNALADSEGFIVAYPQALGAPGASKTEDPESVIAWGASADCCGYASEHEVDDKAFIGAMIDNIESRLNIDKSGVYAAGFSNGAMMSFALGCTMAGRFAAIAPVNGWMEVDCAPSEPVSVMLMHGTADKSIPYEGGIGPQGIIVPSVRSEIDFWTGENGCVSVTNSSVAPHVSAESHTGCINGTEILLYTIEGGGHVWSGPGAPNPYNREISAAGEIWKFFKSHPKGGAVLETKGTDYPLSMNFGGYNRTYILHLPSGFDNSSSYPLVFVFHGLGGSAESIAGLTRFSEKADEEGFIVVYPQGLGRESGAAPSWNVGDCCGWAKDNSIDDIGFVAALMDEMESKFDINGIYSSGHSNGGMMSYRIGCELADRISAIAPVSGALQTEPCAPLQPVPLVAFHGDADAAIPYEGATIFEPGTTTERTFMPVPEEIAFWAELNGCTTSSNLTFAEKVSLEEHTECAEGADVMLYTIEGGAHAWPGGSRQQGSTISATDKIWEFFTEHK